jgi:hypothetical protein
MNNFFIEIKIKKQILFYKFFLDAKKEKHKFLIKIYDKII